MRFSEDDGHLSVYRQPSMNSNGNTIDREGRLITCEHSGRRITRTELDGSITIIADKFEGKKLNSPNDVGGGMPTARSGSPIPLTASAAITRASRPMQEQAKHNVYRVDPKSGDIKVVADDFVRAQRPDLLARREAALHSATPASPTARTIPSHIRMFDVDLAAGKLTNGKVFAEMPKPSITDGAPLRHATGGSVVFGGLGRSERGRRALLHRREGELLGKIHIPETVANLCFGGQQRNRLYICGSTSLYAVYTSAQGAMKP